MKNLVDAMLQKHERKTFIQKQTSNASTQQRIYNSWIHPKQKIKTKTYFTLKKMVWCSFFLGAWNQGT